MTDISFEEIKDEVHQYLLESDEPVYHEEIEAQTGMSHREVGQALMSLLDEDRVDWPAGDEWVALADERKVVEFEYGHISIGICDNTPTDDA